MSFLKKNFNLIKIKNMQVVKFWKLIWSYYKTRIKNKNNKTLIIVWIWAPNLVDVDALRNSEIFNKAWYDIITPEYYWFCRSEWEFTPENSIKTFLDTKNYFKNWILIDVYSWEKIRVNYNNFIFLWMSYGWWVVPLLPKYDKEVKNIAMFYPVTDYTTFGSYWVKEETADDFANSIRRWFSKIYNSIDLPIWGKHFQDKTELIPVKNIKYLKWINLFIAHGTKDISINYQTTRKYFKKLKELYPNWNYKYNQYKWLWHWLDTMIKWSYDMIEFFW